MVTVLGKARWSFFVVTFTVVTEIMQTILSFVMKEIRVRRINFFFLGKIAGIAKK